MNVSNLAPASAGGSPTDTLSDVLRSARFERAVFFDVEPLAPWETGASPAGIEPARAMPNAAHVVAFYVVASGPCVAGLLGGERISLGPGDAIVFPNGDPHVLASDRGTRAPSALPSAIDLRDGSGTRTHVVGGLVGANARPFEPLLASLPRVFCLRDASMPWGAFDPHVRLALAESRARRPGSECVLARLGELVFIESVRRYVAEHRIEPTGWFAGLRDDLVGRALTQLHQRPSHEWSLDELGRKVGASRSVLAERFAEIVGLPPMQYLAQWRIKLAASMLMGTPASLAEVAEHVGYGSEAALSRAFKRVVGVSPALYRQRKRESVANVVAPR